MFTNQLLLGIFSIIFTKSSFYYNFTDLYFSKKI